MTDDDKPIKKGRGHPPQDYKYPKGVSGNPWGRPLGSKNKKKRPPRGLTPSQQIAWEEAHRAVKTSDGEMPAVRAVNRAQLVSAIKGGTNAQRNSLDHIERIEAKSAAELRDAMLKCEEYKQHYEALKQCGSHLASIYDGLVPHPDDIEVDFSTLTIKVHGPATTRERKIWNEGLAAHAKMREMVFQIRREVARDSLNTGLNLELLHWTDRFMRNNDKLPERYRLKRLPIWKQGEKLPMPDLPDQVRKRKLSRLEQVGSRRAV